MAYVERRDPLQNGLPDFALNISSPDGQSNIQVLPVVFHTVVSRSRAGFPSADGRLPDNIAVVPFASTEELLRRYILPLLKLSGVPVSIERPDQQNIDKMLQADAASGVPGAIADSAGAIFKNNGRLVLVQAVTHGYLAHTEKESTTTSILVVACPEGSIEKTMAEYGSLPQAPSSPEWNKRNTEYLHRKMQEITADNQAAQAQIAGGRQRIIGLGQANMAVLNARSAATNKAFAESQQRISDGEAVFRTYLDGSNVSLKWCSANDVRYTTNSAVSPGPGYKRCD